MNLQEIKIELNEIGSKIFKYSLEYDLELEKLVEIYNKILKLKDELLLCSFIGVDLDELEQMRFSLVENQLNIKILIQEHVGNYARDTIEKLKELYESVGENKTSNSE